jgi:hypothetical protein
MLNTRIHGRLDNTCCQKKPDGYREYFHCGAVKTSASVVTKECFCGTHGSVVRLFQTGRDSSLWFRSTVGVAHEFATQPQGFIVKHEYKYPSPGAEACVIDVRSRISDLTEDTGWI